MEISVDYTCYGITSKECTEEILVFHIRLSLVIFGNDTIFATLCLSSVSHKSYVDKH